MKKITLLLFLWCYCLIASAQVLNESAAWPNTNWSVTGVFNTDPGAFESDPTLTSNFAFDDDDAGNGSDDDIAAESPTIDLTTAFASSETWLFVDVDYTYNDLADVLRLEYWDADSSSWVTWQQFTATADQPLDNFCSGTRDSFTSNQLNISSFSSSQLSGFRYRIAFYDDGPGGGAAWEWGFCFDSPTLRSQVPPTCPNPDMLSVSNVTETTVDLIWTETGSSTSWNIEWGQTGFTQGSGNLLADVTTNPYDLTGLTSGTSYDFYVQAICGGGDTSDFIGPFTFVTATPGETCANAFPMNVESDCDGTNSVTFNFANGGDIDANDENPTCDAFGNFGYFVSFTAPAVGSVVFNFDGAADGIGLEVYDSCGGTAISDCENNTFDAGDTSNIIGGLTPGNTYVAVIWRDTASGTADVCIEEGPECPFPINLDALNVTESSADLSWTENGSATVWNIEWGPAGFTQGTGTVINGVNTNPFTLSPLTQNTPYDFYVQADCSSSTSDFSGPFTFTTTPQSNFTLDCANDGPLTQDYCYENGGATNPFIFTFTSNDGTPLNLTFNSGFVENNWDELVVLDSDGNPFPGYDPADQNYGNAGNIGGLSFQSTGDNISFYINSDGSVSCGSGSAALVGGINYTVSCATCINPQATYTVIDDCDNGDQFLIDVDVTSLGDASSLTISNNINSDTVPVTATGTYQVGPFPFLQDVIVTVSNDQDVNCVINSQPIQLLACPPENDNCSGAITAMVNDGPACDNTTQGTILAATPSGVPAGSCTGNTGDDVWFEFTALNEVQIISILNPSGGTTNIDHAVYEGSCGSLSELYCSDDDASVTPQLTVGNTYYIRIFSGGNDNDETTTFDLCIREAPSNIICQNAENFCSLGGVLSTPNIVGIPDPNDLACLGTAPNPVWNIIQIGESGPIEIEINQFDDNGGGLDVDFAIWGPFESVEQACTDIAFEDCPTCPFSNNPDTGFYPFGNIVDCSYSAAAVENLSIDNAQTGEIYMLLVTNFNGNPGTITIEQTNVPDNGSGTIEAEISAEITSNEVLIDPDNDPTETDETFAPCGVEEVVLMVDSPFADTFTWYKNGIVIDGETTSSLTVTETDNYQVVAFDNQCGDDAVSQLVIVNIYNDPGPIDNQTITLCDGPEADGIENFDLDALTASLGFGPDFTVRYYTSTANANSATDAVSSPYSSSGGETLIIRVEDTDAVNDNYLACRQLSEVDLVLNIRPSPGQPIDLEICSASGSASFDLSQNDINILNGQDVSDFTITYHTSQVDADNDTDALSSPFLSDSQTIFARFENNTTGCYDIITFEVIVSDPSQTAISENIEECDNNDGNLDDFANFNLEAHTEVILGSQNPNDYIVSYYASQNDAINNIGELSSPFQSDGQTIFARIQDISLSDCYITTSFELIVLNEVSASIDNNYFYYNELTDEFLLCSETNTAIQLVIIPEGFTENDVTIQWQLDGNDISGETELTLDAESPGEYSAIITLNNTGCSFTLENINVIEIENCVIPQGISPNNDNQNDSFDLSYYAVTKLEIFNRNGTLVYSKTNYTDEWHGQTDDGEELPVGTYFYTMEYENGTKQRSAWVYLNR